MDFTALNLTPLGLGIYNVKDQAAREALTGKIAYAEYNSQSKTILFYNTADSPTSDNILCYIDARGFIKDGMVDSVVVEDGNLVITFNTDSGKEPISIPLTDIFNPDLYYTKSQIDAAMQKKANTDGWYPRMVVGAAESLIGKDISVDEATDYVVQGATGIAKVNEVMGGSEKWNQITEPKIAASIPGITIEYNESNNTYRYYGTTVATGSIYLTKMFAVAAKHKYLISYPHTLTSGEEPYGGNIGFVRHMLSETGGSSILYFISWNKNYAIFSTAENDDNVKIGVAANGEKTFDVTLRAFNLFDLTDIYGEGNEPTTVEQFEADIFAKYGKTLDEYFEYNVGSINNANVEKLDITGFNQWDEQWENGGISSSTGNNTSDSNRIRSKGYIPILPNTTYYCKAPQTSVNILYYDADKNYLSQYNTSRGNNVFPISTVAGAAYIRFNIGSSSTPITTYNHDICINISDPSSNGEYQPYKSSTLSTPITEIVSADKPTVRLNQLFDNDTPIAFSYDNSGNSAVAVRLVARTKTVRIPNHKYYAFANFVGDRSGIESSYIGYLTGTVIDVTSQAAIIASANTSSSTLIELDVRIKAGASVNGTFQPILIDLTEMYGTGSEPTIPSIASAEITELSGLSYIPYNTGEDIPNRIFPVGMKSAGTAYDEWNGSAATKRIGVVDLGMLTYTRSSSGLFVVTHFAENFNAKPNPSTYAPSNLLLPGYRAVGGSPITGSDPEKEIALHTSGGGTLYINTAGQFTDISAFQAAMSGVLLYYELATPIEYTTEPLDTSEEVIAPMVCDFQYGKKINKCNLQIYKDRIEANQLIEK